MYIPTQPSQDDITTGPFRLYDSFEGNSTPMKHDAKKETKGKFAASVDRVKQTMRGFPDVEYHKGWIPEAFDYDEDVKYRFVHLDVNMYEPTLECLRYFLPRLSTVRAMIVLDDYGMTGYPGMKKAVWDYHDEDGSTPFRVMDIDSGQAFIWRSDL
jgi:hypothetical protein